MEEETAWKVHKGQSINTEANIYFFITISDFREGCDTPRNATLSRKAVQHLKTVRPLKVR